MSRLDPNYLRSYAHRDWRAPERLARAHRARQPVERKVQLAIELYEAVRATRPDWPDDAPRRADLESHLRVRALLDKAAHVGARSGNQTCSRCSKRRSLKLGKPESLGGG